MPKFYVQMRFEEVETHTAEAEIEAADAQAAVEIMAKMNTEGTLPWRTSSPSAPTDYEYDVTSPDGTTETL
jgi:hypothetical protein